jgi:TorA maturation chaperone TorD
MLRFQVSSHTRIGPLWLGAPCHLSRGGSDPQYSGRQPASGFSVARFLIEEQNYSFNKNKTSGGGGLSQPQSEHLVAVNERVAPEDLLRAQMYKLLARFLSGPPTAGDLAAAAALKGDDSALGQAISTFARLAGHGYPAIVKEEYQELFIGLGRGELVPYGSYYLTGFLQEKPLAKLRQDMERLGIARSAEVRDPEDHIASLCEMMAGLIEGRFGPPLPLPEQKRFFETHLGSWAGYFFRDLEAARSSVLYSALGSVGRTFLEIEEGAFALV